MLIHYAPRRTNAEWFTTGMHALRSTLKLGERNDARRPRNNEYSCVSTVTSSYKYMSLQIMRTLLTKTSCRSVQQHCEKICVLKKNKIKESAWQVGQKQVLRKKSMNRERRFRTRFLIVLIDRPPTALSNSSMTSAMHGRLLGSSCTMLAIRSLIKSK